MASSNAFTDDQLADLAKAEALALWRKHRKLEMFASGIAAPVSAFLVGTAVYIFWDASTGITFSAIVAAIIAGVLGVAITLGIIYAYYRFVEAPSSLYFKASRDLEKAQRLLEEEKAKNAEPKLAGTIICLNTESKPDIEAHIARYNCYITLLLSLTNDSSVATMATGFTLDLLWEGIDYPGVSESVAGYYRQRPHRSAESAEQRIETELIALEKFPVNEEIRNTNHQIGYLRFSVGALPLNAVASANRLNDEVQLRLRVFDNKRVLRTIYEGPFLRGPSSLFGGCGTIEKKTMKLY